MKNTFKAKVWETINVGDVSPINFVNEYRNADISSLNSAFLSVLWVFLWLERDLIENLKIYSIDYNIIEKKIKIKINK